MKPPRVILSGYGRWGKNIARVLHELGALAAIVDHDASARSGARSLGVPVFADIDDVPAGFEARALAIATPAATHTHVALRGLDRGWDVFVEKPLALSVEDAELLTAEADRRGAILMTGHILLYHPAVRALKRLIAEGELGDIRYLYSNRLNLGRVRREENILWSFAPHDIAVILHLLGEFPTQISAVGGAWILAGVADVTTTHMAFPGGARAHVFVSWLHPHKEQRLVVVGSRKMAVFDDLNDAEKLVVLDAGVDIESDGIPTERQGPRTVVAFESKEPLRAELEHFLQSIRTRQAPLTDGKNGIDVLRVIAAAEADLPRPRPGSRVEKPH